MTTTDHSDFDQLIGRNLRRLRKSARYTQAELAAELTQRGMPGSVHLVQRIELGRRELRFDEALVIADFFGVPVASLANRAEVATVTASRSTTWDVEQLTDRVRQMEAELERLTMEAQQPSLPMPAAS